MAFGYKSYGTNNTEQVLFVVSNGVIDLAA